MDEQDHSVEAGKELAGATTESAPRNADALRALSGRDLDVAVAERVMGWQRWELSSGVRLHSPDAATWLRVLAPNARITDAPYNDVGSMPRYSTDRAAAMQMEDRIAEMGPLHRLAYLDALRDLLETEQESSLWNLVHATAEQRCRAALAALVFMS